MTRRIPFLRIEVSDQTTGKHSRQEPKTNSLGGSEVAASPGGEGLRGARAQSLEKRKSDNGRVREKRERERDEFTSAQPGVDGVKKGAAALFWLSLLGTERVQGARHVAGGSWLGIIGGKLPKNE